MSQEEHHGTVNEKNHFVPRSVFYKSKYGRLFRRLEPLANWSVDHFKKLAESMFDSDLREDPSLIPAGYTYLGQFINHDITFDPTSELGEQNDPERINNFRTPRFDLDSLYGRGPLDSRYMYKPDQMRFIIENIDLSKKETDLQRTWKTDDSNENHIFRHSAIIGDPRNDENMIVSQLHLAFMKFHNQVVQKLIDELLIEEKKLSRPRRRQIFIRAQEITRFHYQWLVVNDFLPRIVTSNIVNDILDFEYFAVATVAKVKKSKIEITSEKIKHLKPKFIFYDWKENPFLPVEFSVASFRFGHSMIRPFYVLNRKIQPSKVPIFSSNVNDLKLAQGLERKAKQIRKVARLVNDDFPNEVDAINHLIDIADDLKGQAIDIENEIDTVGLNPKPLTGFQERSKNWTIEWGKFFGSHDKKNSNLQFAQKINTKLTKALAKLPFLAEEDSLALRNLLRGDAFQLASGQSIARTMGIPECLILPENGIEKTLLIKGKPIKKSTILPGNVAKDLGYGAETPLWYYILKEAEIFMDGEYLGPVGGRIVAEVLIGLLVGDPNSYINKNAFRTPQEDVFKDCFEGDFTMLDFLKIADGEYEKVGETKQ